MGLSASHSVEIEISNKTQSITLKNPRTYLDCGVCSHSPLPELSPGSKDTCRFSGNSPFWNVAGILVYEADSFTLAIHFSINCFRFPMELGLELSPGKAHLGRLVDTYIRMANGTYSSSRLDIQFDRGVVSENPATVQVSDGPIKVTATGAANSLLKVVLEEQRGSGEEPGSENPCQRRSKRLLFFKRSYQER